MLLLMLLLLMLMLMLPPLLPPLLLMLLLLMLLLMLPMLFGVSVPKLCEGTIRMHRNYKREADANYPHISDKSRARSRIP